MYNKLDLILYPEISKKNFIPIVETVEIRKTYLDDKKPVGLVKKTKKTKTKSSFSL